jgi:hypothetical protein
MLLITSRMSIPPQSSIFKYVYKIFDAAQNDAAAKIGAACAHVFKSTPRSRGTTRLERWVSACHSCARLNGGASRTQRRGRISVGYDGEAGVELEHTGGNLQIDGPAQSLRCGVKGMEEGGGGEGAGVGVVVVTLGVGGCEAGTGRQPCAEFRPFPRPPLRGTCAAGHELRHRGWGKGGGDGGRGGGATLARMIVAKPKVHACEGT